MRWLRLPKGMFKGMLCAGLLFCFSALPVKALAAQVTAQPAGFALQEAEPVPQAQAEAYHSEVCRLSAGDEVSFTADIPETGTYYMKFDYLDLTNGYNKSDLSLQVNGAYPDADLSRVALETFWKSETDQLETDRYGNEIAPQQQLAQEWFTIYAWDVEHQKAHPIEIALQAGENAFTITLNSGEIMLGDVSFVAAEELPTYQEYAGTRQDKRPAMQTLTLEAETPSYKSNVSILSTSESDMDAVPYDTYHKLINVIGGGSYSEAGQALSYAFEVPESGLYRIALKCKQDGVQNMSVFRRIELDGAVPFAELAHYGFPYSENFQVETLGDENGDYLIWLEEGTHHLTLTADISLYENTINELKEVSTELNRLYLDLKKLVGASNDKNRDWTMTDYFPDIVPTLTDMADRVDAAKAQAEEINGKGGNYVSAYLQTASRVLRSLAEEPDKIPAQISKLTEDSSSAAASITSALGYLKTQPLTLDEIYIMDAQTEIAWKSSDPFARLADGAKKLAASFTTDYSGYQDDEAITVWVNRSSILVDQIQKMADAEFTPQTGIKVNFRQITDESKLTLSAMAGESPDAVLGISYWMPFELGTRGICADLSQFEDYNEVASRFAPGALIPFLVNDKAYAIPETQNATVLYYRKDIMEALNLPIPQTWDEVIEILPELQRNGMNFYIPVSDTSGTKGINSTAPFIYQYGGSLYNETGTAAAFDSEQAITGLKRLTDFYTIYGLPYQVSSFYNKFSDGTLPIGVASFDVYVTLTSAAPELAGLWDIALAPGVKQADGTIARWQSGGATSCMIFESSKRKQESWELLKWWMSDDVQTRFSMTIKSLYGDAYIWNTSNLAAFQNVPMDASHRETIMEQWQWMMEYPRIPGAYMTEREISNVWNNVVFNSKNLRDQIDIATDNVNNEIVRKLNEFGFMKDNTVLKPFKVNSIDSVKELIGGVKPNE